MWGNKSYDFFNIIVSTGTRDTELPPPPFFFKLSEYIFIFNKVYYLISFSLICCG